MRDRGPMELSVRSSELRDRSRCKTPGEISMRRTLVLHAFMAALVHQERRAFRLDDTRRRID